MSDADGVKVRGGATGLLESLLSWLPPKTAVFMVIDQRLLILAELALILSDAQIDD